MGLINFQQQQKCLVVFGNKQTTTISTQFQCLVVFGIRMVLLPNKTQQRLSTLGKFSSFWKLFSMSTKNILSVARVFLAPFVT
jgi:hypothetical protein